MTQPIKPANADLPKMAPVQGFSAGVPKPCWPCDQDAENDGSRRPSGWEPVKEEKDGR